MIKTPDQTIGVESIKKRAVAGIIFLAGKRVATQVIQTVSMVILARILFPQVFGAFAFLVFITEFLALMVSQGMVSALVQRKGKLSAGDVNTVFWTVTMLSFLPFGLVWFSGEFVNTFLKASVVGDAAVHLMAIAVFLFNLKLVSSSVMERQIRFVPLTIIDTGESLTAAAVSVSLVVLGWGFSGLLYGYLAGKFLAIILLSFFGTFRPRLTFVSKSLKKFGVSAFHFQTYSLASSISGSIAPVYVGRVVGPAGVGYLSWAGGIGLLPWAIAELVGKITFPVSSRIQAEKKLLAIFLDRSFELLLLVVVPVSLVLLFFAEPITNIVFTYKWLPAVWALRYFVLLGLVVSLCTVASNALLAIGEVKFVRNVSLVSMGIFWILALILIPRLGFEAHPLSWFLGSLVQFIFVFKIRRLVKVYYLQKVLFYLFLSSVSVLPLWFFAPVARNIFELISHLFLMFVIYLSLIAVFRREQILFYFKELRLTILRKS